MIHPLCVFPAGQIHLGSNAGTQILHLVFWQQITCRQQPYWRCKPLNPIHLSLTSSMSPLSACAAHVSHSSGTAALLSIT
ncbi:uncharacterized [Tachysurus ichikawai]